MRILIALFALALSAAEDGQPNLDNGVRYVVSHVFSSLSGTAGKVSIVVPANTGRGVYLAEAAISCSVACVFNQNLNGTVTGGTQLTPTVLNFSGTPTAVATVYRDATVTGGTSLVTWNVPAVNQAFPVALHHVVFRRSNTAQSYSFDTGNMTGSATLALIYMARN